MSWWRDFADRIEFDAPIGRATWFRLGGRARYLCRPRDAADLTLLMDRARQDSIPMKVLGAGANVLVRDDGFDGVVVRLDAPAFRSVDYRGTSVRVGAGVDMMPLCKSCAERGLSGLEGLAGIPGTVGGAVRMNAGGRFGEFADVVREVEVITSEGDREVRSSEQLGFSYRRSDLKNAIVLSARLELTGDDPREVRRRHDERLAYKQESQPLADKSAGCIFKNPGDQSAGALIDQSGLKGMTVGQASVSRRHANFIVAGAGATAADVTALIELIQARVLREFDTSLELEIDIW